MLIFHEGLPGAGKSYAAIKDHVVPALRKGRKVFAYVEGLNHDRIALVSGITSERCQELLVQISKEQVPTIYDHVENDAFVVIDELQDFWPSSRVKLEPKITEFITQHRHRGLDVLLMGQVFMDVHTMWRGRVDQLVFFYNRDAVGKADEYKWSVRKRESNGKFAEITNGVEKYNPDYFGTYASHSSGTENKEKYADARANVWNSPVLKRMLPIYAVVALVCLGVVIWAFRGGIAGKATEKAELAAGREMKVERKEAAAEEPTKPQKTAAAEVPEGKISPPGDWIDELTSKYRIRIGGVIKARGRETGWIEWRDSDSGLKEILSFNQLSGLGWLVLTSPDGDFVVISKLSRKYYVTAWPVEDVKGRASQATLREASGETGRPGKS